MILYRIQKIWFRLISRGLISCYEASLLSSKSLDQKLDLQEKLKLKYHQLNCHVCKKYENDIFLLHRFFKNHYSHPGEEQFTLSPKEKTEIRENVQNHLGS